MKVGEVQNIGIICNPENTTDEKDVLWTSSDDTIISVENGKLTALKAGIAEITAKVGEKTVTCKITVTENTTGKDKVDKDKTDKDKSITNNYSAGKKGESSNSGSVKTADTANIALYIILMFTALCSIFVIVYQRKIRG